MISLNICKFVSKMYLIRYILQISFSFGLALYVITCHQKRENTSSLSLHTKILYKIRYEKK